MGCGGFAGWGSGTPDSFGRLVTDSVRFVGDLSAQILTLVTSGPVLGFLAALVLLLGVVALLKVIFTQGSRPQQRGKALPAE